MNVFSAFIFLISLAWVTSVSATPMALNVSQLLESEDSHVYFGSENFKISTEDTDWIRLPSTNSSSILTQFVNPDTQAKLTVRSEKLKQKLSLKGYVTRSLRDYNRFGFEILAQRPLKINDQAAFLLDLKQNRSPIQLRQVLYKKDKDVIILTCSSHHDSFKQELKNCNQIYRNFKWL